ncbi:alpha/beta hydrolase [Pseudomonas sp. MAFF 302030]|uniref:Alpha/beta hydrolase n=1 Tax=Pseudomonas morbosilactucae TaxID=2938197 RepID=A0A9X1Z295_9PSED|nr:alpha/beta hydrolase [Pseudomonas morbosilactucae]MCK9802261.1 alpha/beta hydrolase [Pseudomonas morbosilactucae]
MREQPLIIVVGGLGNHDGAWRRLEAKLREQGISGDWHHHDTRGLRSLFRTARVRDLTLALIAEIDDLAQEYSRIILVGHSAGGMIIRDAYLFAAGAYPDHPQRREWWNKVESVLLFASINRGFRPYATTCWALGLALMKLISLQWLLLKPPSWFALGWLMELEKGSFVVTDLRLSWMRHFHERDDEHRPFVVQFLGDIDGVVAREDVRDTEAFANSYTVTIEGADHNNLFDPQAPPGTAGFARILQAFQNPDPRVSEPEQAQELAATGPGMVVFVLHGIRDGNSGWVTDIAEAIEQQCKADQVQHQPLNALSRCEPLRSEPPVLVDRSTYGWFSAIKFALPWVRRRNLSWFLDRYSYHVARNPDVKFHFVGHSNGTYILGTSLLEVPSLMFDRVYLAGSVLPREFPWKRMLARQVVTVANQCSSEDWPVGGLCRGLHLIGFRDVGTGGVDGFDELDDSAIQAQTLWFKGDHGKPLQRPNQPKIVSYLLSPNMVNPLLPAPTGVDLCQRPSFWFMVKMYGSALLVLVGVCALAFGAWWGFTHDHEGLVIIGILLLYFVLDTI